MGLTLITHTVSSEFRESVFLDVNDIYPENGSVDFMSDIIL